MKPVTSTDGISIYLKHAHVPYQPLYQWELESVHCTSNSITSYKLLPRKFDAAFINDSPSS